MRNLLVLALLPPLILMILVYRKDCVEREPVGLIIKTIIFGAICAIPTIIVELVLGSVLESVASNTTILGMILENFIGVALVEEFFKMKAFKWTVWKNKEFNYTFDGVVYCVASAIGFAALENVLYVTELGMGTAIIRAVTAIPGHTIFGLMMGTYMGFAKYHEVNGDKGLARSLKMKALLVPTLIHGTYDFLCSIEDSTATIAFFVGLVILDIVAIRRINKYQKMDTAIYPLEENSNPEDDLY